MRKNKDVYTLLYGFPGFHHICAIPNLTIMHVDFRVKSRFTTYDSILFINFGTQNTHKNGCSPSDLFSLRKMQRPIILLNNSHQKQLLEDLNQHL